MAYLDIDNMFAAPVRSRPADAAVATDTGFSALEWSVIAVSRRDGQVTLLVSCRTSCRNLNGLSFAILLLPTLPLTLPRYVT